MLILSHQQLHSLECASDSSCCVEARTKNEANTTSGNRATFQSCGANHRPQSDVLRLRKHLQAVSHKHAVFAAQLCNVCNSRERDEIEHSPDESVVFSHFTR